MKSIKCDLCEVNIEAETFDDWFTFIRAHWAAAHADTMKAMKQTGSKEEGEKWRNSARAKFDAA